MPRGLWPVGPAIKDANVAPELHAAQQEFEGVVVETSEETHRQAWLQVADEFRFRKPLGQSLRRIKGVRDEVVVSRIFGWTHNPSVARQVAQRKAELYETLMGGRQLAAMLETRPFLETLKRYSIPVALATPLSESKVKDGLQRHNLAQYFDAVVTAEDSGSAEVEFYYAYAASKIQRPPIRCVVVGESNTSVEAAHELGMKCVVVTGASSPSESTAGLGWGFRACGVRTLVLDHVLHYALTFAFNLAAPQRVTRCTWSLALLPQHRHEPRVRLHGCRPGGAQPVATVIHEHEAPVCGGEPCGVQAEPAGGARAQPGGRH